MEDIIIAIFAHSVLEFKRAQFQIQSKLDIIHTALNIKILHCNSRSESRLNFLQRNLNKWILFLDADCELTDAGSRRIISLTESYHSRKSGVVYTGYYENCHDLTYLQKVHNFIANCWLLSSFDVSRTGLEPRTFLLGGIFLLYADSEKISSVQLDLSSFWGAEDKILSQKLLEVGYQIQFCSQLKVIHRTADSWVHFFKRAYFHGFNDPQVMTQISEIKSKIQFWSSEFRRSHLIFLPAIGLHFLFLGLGKSLQLFRPKNR